MSKLNPNREKRETDLVLIEASQILQATTSGIRLVDLDYNVIQANEALARLSDCSRDNTIGTKCYQSFPGAHCQTENCPVRQITAGSSPPINCEVEKTRADGSRIVCQLSVKALTNQVGETIGIVEDFVDITKRLEIERDLRETKRTLEIEGNSLEAKNVALREILDQIEDGKQELADQISTNVERVLMPIVESISVLSGSPDEHRLRLLKSCLRDIVTPFVTELDRRFGNLTPRETEICIMIRQNMSSKDISRTLSTSLGTVQQQRKTIRRKLGIAGTKTNLTTFLATC